MREGRTKNAIKNTYITILCQIFSTLVNFGCRTIFIRLLGVEYLGINGLFTNILTLLSFAEMGIGNAIIFKLYKPLIENDTNKIQEYMQLYKILYYVISIAVFIVGIALIPFLNNLVNAPDIKENISLIYFLFLINTCTSYLYSYKKSILIANQKKYLLSIYQQVFNIIMYIGQIAILRATRNYILYLLIMIVVNMLCNIRCSIIAGKKYPFINEKAKGKLSKVEIKGFIEDVKGLFASRVASTSFQGTDNIFISKFINIDSVGIVSNYCLVLEGINNIFNQISVSITATVGNLGVTSGSDHKSEVFKRVYFGNGIVFGYIGIGALLLLGDFVSDIWLTSEYEIPELVVACLTIEMILRGIHYPVFTFRTATGHFSEYKIASIISAILNLVLDYLLVNIIGLTGIYVSTIISRCITRYVDAFVLFKEEFHLNVSLYYIMHLKFIAFLSILALGLRRIIKAVSLSGIIGFLINILIITLGYFGAVFLVYHERPEFYYYKSFLKQNILYRKGKKFSWCKNRS